MAASDDKKSPNDKKWRPTAKHEQAALLVAAGELKDEDIASKVGIARQTLCNWNTDPRFSAMVDAHLDVMRKRIRSYGIAIMENRVAALQRRWDKMNAVIEARAADPAMRAVAGGDSGLLCRDVKSIGGGVGAREVEIFSVDTALLKELREHEKQAAQELGQWTEKQDVTSGGKPLAVKVLRGVTMDEI